MDLSMIFGVFLFIGVALFFISKDLMSEVEKINTYRLRIAEQYEAVELLSRLRGDAKEALGYRQHMAILLPEKDQILYLREWLIGLGSSYGTEVNFAFTGDTDATPIAPGFVTFNLFVRGSYEGATQFLKYLETDNQRFLIQLDNFDFRRTGLKDYQIASRGKAYHR